MKEKKHPLELNHLTNDTIPLLPIMIEDTIEIKDTIDSLVLDTIPVDTVVVDTAKVEPKKTESVKSRIKVTKKNVQQLDVRQKTVTLLCTNGKKLQLTFYIPGNEFVNPLMEKEVNRLSLSLKENPHDKVFLVGEEQSRKNLDQRVLRNDRVLLTYLKKMLMAKGVRSDQIIIGTAK